MKTPTRTIVSGGQTGVDRAALDVALALGLTHGGWCPAGRRAEDGRIPDRYLLRETGSPDYAVRTEWNVRDADATLVLCSGPARGGTALTVRLARRHAKPLLIVDLSAPPPPASVRRWLAEHGVVTLNVAGPRKSTAPGAHEHAARYLRTVLIARGAARATPRA